MEEKLLILFIDDDPDDTNLFVETVAELEQGIECITVSDGIKALAYLKDENNKVPDYIFLDLRMPKMSGLKCLTQIKQIKRLNQVPVFVYSTSREEKDVLSLKKEGAIMFISKPTNPEEIYYLLSTIIGEKWNNKKR